MTRARNDGWVWLNAAVLRAVHEEQLLEHGGPGGVRDEGLVDSALARPRHWATYSSPDAAALAAAYAYGLARNHPFVDGNKRTAFVAMELFLSLNGQVLMADDADCVAAMVRLAAGRWTEDQLAAWVRSHLQPVLPP